MIDSDIDGYRDEIRTYKRINYLVIGLALVLISLGLLFYSNERLPGEYAKNLPGLLIGLVAVSINLRVTQIVSAKRKIRALKKLKRALCKYKERRWRDESELSEIKSLISKVFERILEVE